MKGRENNGAVMNANADGASKRKELTEAVVNASGWILQRIWRKIRRLFFILERILCRFIASHDIEDRVGVFQMEDRLSGLHYDGLYSLKSCWSTLAYSPISSIRNIFSWHCQRLRLGL